ncbi:MAG TPA: pseudouridine synthase [Verrucomicrobiota bacterium]|nr:pseudouridine synthase [Verrucomicrobiota bacterium]HRT07337.1 pseudouridine synthase [Candidatus Paceibacterota bacterium]HRT55209.1 pseudouridine synthase [Candidatus Paceibacterota bacterium]
MLFEDEHLLAVNKPAGWNTHAPAPFAGEGIYDWLRHRDPRWAALALIHRLDKETSGVLLFAKTALARRSLTDQFTRRSVRKRYLLFTDRPPREAAFLVRSCLVRAGEKYLSRPPHAGGELAETHFRALQSREAGRWLSAAGPGIRDVTVLEAEPRTGRTHQIRVHAAEVGLPILGDTLYGGSPAPRVCLHAAGLRFLHPASEHPLEIVAPLPRLDQPRLELRHALFDPERTNTYRLVHGASDGWPGWYVDRLGDYLLSQAEEPLTGAQQQHLEWLLTIVGARGAYHKRLSRQVRQTPPEAASPQPVLGQAAPERFAVRENGLQFELSFHEGYSVGLFLDQRDNRRRLLAGHVGAGFGLAPALNETGRNLEVLNTFAYTCAFSVCAARAGARVTSLDLSKKYLDWGRRNFSLNQLDPAAHDFIFGDAFDWLRRLDKKGRRFDLVLLDPPTFSQSKQSGVFRAARDYGRLVRSAAALLRPGGILFASSNAAGWAPEDFQKTVLSALSAAGWAARQSHYVPQPPDFPISREEPAYLKTLWLKLE